MPVMQSFDSCRAGKILGECHEFVSERKGREGNGGGIVGYEDIGAEAFGGLGRAIVSTSMYIELLGTCALLFILEVTPAPSLCRSSCVPPCPCAEARRTLCHQNKDEQLTPSELSYDFALLHPGVESTNSTR